MREHVRERERLREQTEALEVTNAQLEGWHLEALSF